MKTLIMRAILCTMPLLGAPALLGQTPSSASSLSTTPDAPASSSALREHSARSTTNPFAVPLRRGGHFPRVAVGLKLGTAGIGAELATPLASRANLRAGGQFFDYGTTFTAYGVDTNAHISLHNVYAAVDLFPFHNSSFHLSPGVAMLADNHVTSSFVVPGGHKLLLGDGEYTSDPKDPIHGAGLVQLGDKVAPRLTAGWGNLFPHGVKRVTFPFELGAQFSTAPTVRLDLNGSACNAAGCESIKSGTAPQDLERELNSVRSQLSPLRFYPIASFGVSYRFGRDTEAAR